MPGEQLNQAIALIKSGKKEPAREILTRLVRSDPRNDIAWLWLAEAMPGEKDRIVVLEAGLKANPQSQVLQRGLARLREHLAADLEQPSSSESIPAEDPKILRQALIGKAQIPSSDRLRRRPSLDESRAQEESGAQAWNTGDFMPEQDDQAQQDSMKPRKNTRKQTGQTLARGFALLVFGLVTAAVVGFTGYMMQDQLRAWLGFSKADSTATPISSGAILLMSQTPTQSGPTATITPTPTITPIPTPTATVAFSFSYSGISPENAAQVSLVGELASIPARCVAISSDNILLAAGMNDASVYVWELASGNILHILKGHTKPVDAVVFSTDGRYLISGSEDGTLRIWDLAADAELATLTGHTGAVKAVAFSPDGRTFASGSLDGSLLLWQLGTHTPLKTLPVDGPITSVDFSHDGRLLAAGLETGAVKVWDAAAGTLLVSMPAHSGAVNSVSFAPNGHRMVTGSADTTVKLWDVDSGKVLYTIGSHTEAVLVVAFSPDGRLVASASSGQAIKLWDVAGRREIALIRHARNMLGLAFTMDGRVLAAALSPTNPASNEGGVALWGVLHGTGSKPDLEPLTISSMQKELWIPGARMAVPHAAHQSVLILGDRLMIISGGEGTDPASYTYKVELYNPSSGASLLTNGLDTSRGLFSATLLKDGRVLVVAGYNPGDQWIAGAELYDPLSAAWSISQPLYTHGIGHTATLLNDGRVLVAGGCSGNGAPGRISQVELFDPASNSWSDAAAMSQSRCGHFAALLTDGHVLVAGGENGENTLSSVELYDPVANQWSQSGALNVARTEAVAVTLSDGRVMVTGGRTMGAGGESAINSVEIYDINSRKWTQVMPMQEARYAHTANLLPGGEILVVGGLEDLENGVNRFLGSVEVYDPQDDSWSQIASIGSPRAYHTTTLLPDGRIFVTGGMSAEGVILASTEILVVSRPPIYEIPTPVVWPTSTPTLNLSSTMTATITGTLPVEITPTLTPEGASGGSSSILVWNAGSPDPFAGSAGWYMLTYFICMIPQKLTVLRDQA